MKKCTELLKNGNKSLVEIRETDTDKVEKYVVCQDFDNSKAYGSKWNMGSYFDVWGNNSAEDMMKSAALYLYGINESKISFERLTDLAKVFMAELRDYVDDDEEFADVLKSANITEDEAEFFNVKNIVFPKLYKIINATLKREQYVTIQVVVPNDADEWSTDDYIENKEYIEDAEDIESEDWELDDYGVEEDGLTKEEFKSRYSANTVWNADDIDNLDEY